MNITIKASNTTLTGAIKNSVKEKLEILERFLKEEDKVHVEFEYDKTWRDGKHYQVDIDIQPRGHYAQVRAEDFYQALDMLLPKIKEQLVKSKDKSMSMHRIAARKLKGK